MLSERLSTLPGELLSFRPCPPARDRAGWAQLPSSARERLLAAGEAEAWVRETYPEIDPQVQMTAEGAYSPSFANTA